MMLFEKSVTCCLQKINDCRQCLALTVKSIWAIEALQPRSADFEIEHGPSLDAFPTLQISPCKLFQLRRVTAMVFTTVNHTKARVSKSPVDFFIKSIGAKLVTDWLNPKADKLRAPCSNWIRRDSAFDENRPA
jgi:hypothetical protein